VSLENLRLTARTARYACGIYDAGDPDKCYVKLFVTDSGRVLPLNHRVITEEDVMDAYTWGRQDAVEAYGVKNAVGADGGYSEDSYEILITTPDPSSGDTK
jgi:hypothetical protein